MSFDLTRKWIPNLSKETLKDGILLEEFKNKLNRRVKKLVFKISKSRKF